MSSRAFVKGLGKPERTMVHALARPLRFRALAAVSAALLLANTVYCLLYTWLSGRAEPIAEALGWSIANVLPWLWAFEVGKRWQRPAAAVGGGALVSMLLGALLLGSALNWFELTRRLPGALFLLGLLLILKRREVRTSAGGVELPLPPEHIAWVAAAGNYVELHGADRALLMRAPLAAVEQALAPHGFVRIHRSTLVNRRRIARVRGADLLLDDGRSLKLGSSFRSRLGI